MYLCKQLKKSSKVKSKGYSKNILESSLTISSIHVRLVKDLVPPSFGAMVRTHTSTSTSLMASRSFPSLLTDPPPLSLPPYARWAQTFTTTPTSASISAPTSTPA